MEKILIIDDNEDIVEMFEHLLVDNGYNVSTATNGAKGLKLFRNDNFDLVITDINMPGISGFEVLENIKEDFTLVPIILMSSDYLPVNTNDVKRLGVNAIISKTIDDYDFCNLVRCCLEDKVYEAKIF